jgi:hypothetical protein
MRELAVLLEREAPASLHGVNVDTAYLVGLMADLGASFILYLVDQRSLAGLGPPSTQICLAAVHANHAEVGAALLGHWMTDPQMVAAVATHHPPDEGSLTSQARMMVVASEIVRGVPGAMDVTARPPSRALLDRCLGELRLDQARLAGLTAVVAERFRETMDLLS